MNIYGSIFRRFLNPLWETRLRKRPTLSRVAELERTEWLSHDELTAIQTRAFRALLDHSCAHVPFYRDRMKRAGLEPGDLRSLDDVMLLPLVRRPEASENPDSRVSEIGPAPVIKKGTSGSTGTPLTFGYEWESEYWRQAIRLRGYGWAGYQQGSRSLHFWGAPVFPKPPVHKRIKVDVDHRIRREVVLPSTLRGDADLLRVVDAIVSHRPENIICYAQAGGDLARFINARGLRRWRDIPVICGAEKLYAHDRAAMVEAFGSGIFETYGSREVMLMASECSAHDGLHVQMENILLEVVVEEAGRVRSAAPGESGEIVITDLHNYAMPFIRYVNGDLGTWKKEGRCSCGRALVRLASVEGRVTETLRDAEGRAIGGLVYNAMFASLADTVREFQIVQARDRSITVRVIPTERFSTSTETSIRKTHEAHFGSVPLRIEKVAEIPLTSAGKRQPVVVEK